MNAKRILIGFIELVLTMLSCNVVLYCYVHETKATLYYLNYSLIIALLIAFNLCIWLIIFAITKYTDAWKDVKNHYITDMILTIIKMIFCMYVLVWLADMHSTFSEILKQLKSQ